MEGRSPACRIFRGAGVLYCPIFMLGQSQFFLAVSHRQGGGSRGEDKGVSKTFQS